MYGVDDLNGFLKFDGFWCKKTRSVCNRNESNFDGQVAQLVEQRTENPCVGWPADVFLLIELVVRKYCSSSDVRGFACFIK